jgi:hypothetical protein
MVGLAEDESSSMVPELKFWVQFSPATHFLPLRVIIPSLVCKSRPRAQAICVLSE